MNITISQLKKSYDTVIIGNGLSPLLLATVLQRHGQKTLVIDPQETESINCRYLGLETLPETTNTNSTLQFLEEILLEPISTQSLKETPITFEAGFKPFVGFGDQTPDFIEELDFYTHTPSLSLGSSFTSWLEKLTESYQGDHLTGYQPTEFTPHEEEKLIKEIHINNSKVSCQSIIYCDLPNKLLSLIKQELLLKKTIKALHKVRLWTSISLDLEHSQKVSENKNLHVLMGSTDKSDPCWGRFFEKVSNNDNVTEETHFSQWMSLIPAERTADAEHLGLVLKKIQKQLKRAYPEINETISKEKILVHYASHGQMELPLTGHQTLSEFENLWVASSCIHPQRNLIALVQQAQLVLSAMGFDISSPGLAPVTESADSNGEEVAPEPTEAT